MLKIFLSFALAKSSVRSAFAGTVDFWLNLLERLIFEFCGAGAGHGGVFKKTGEF